MQQRCKTTTTLLQHILLQHILLQHIGSASCMNCSSYHIYTPLNLNSLQHTATTLQQHCNNTATTLQHHCNKQGQRAACFYRMHPFSNLDCLSRLYYSFSVLQYVAVCCSVLQYVAVSCIVLHCVAVSCSVLQCAAVSCSISVCCST